MANPTLTASLNKETFAPGEEMVLTVQRSDADSHSGSVTIVVTDSQGNSSEPIIVPWTVQDQTTVSVTDSSRVWTLDSDNGHTAVYKSVA